MSAAPLPLVPHLQGRHAQVVREVPIRQLQQIWTWETCQRGGSDRWMLKLRWGGGSTTQDHHLGPPATSRSRACARYCVVQEPLCHCLWQVEPAEPVRHLGRAP